MIVLDTNIVLDLLVFDDPAAQPLRQTLDEGRLRWMATPSMREELSRVLDYPQIVARLTHYRIDAQTVLAGFDRQVQLIDAPARAPVRCKDPDDQKFIDLAVACQAVLLSKDRAVLCMRKRLAALGVRVQVAL